MRTTGTTALLAPVLVVFSSGCALPDLGPLADATAQIHAATQQVGTSLVEDLERLALLEAEDHAFKEYPATFRKAWDERLSVMAALVEYSDALAGIVDAAGKFGENATSLADSVSGLLAAGGVNPANVLSDAALSVVTIGGEALVTIKAHSDMDKAVEAADPAVQRVAKILGKDLVKLEELLGRDGLAADIESGLKKARLRAAGADLAYRDSLLYSRETVEQLLDLEAGAIRDLQQAILELRGQIVAVRLAGTTVLLLEGRDGLSGDQQEDLASARATVAEGEEQALVDKIEKIESSIGEYTAALNEHRATQAQIDQWIKGTDVWYGPMTTELEALHETFSIQRRAVSAAREAVREWATIHAALAKSLRDKRQPSVRLLIGTAKRLRAALDASEATESDANDGTTKEDA